MKVTFEALQAANESIKTTTIKNKEYAEVNQRIKAFRMVYPMGIIRTKIIPKVDGVRGDGVCAFRAYVYANGDDYEKPLLLGTGTAYEREGSSLINNHSHLENAETSAVGRALGMAGFGIDTSVRSADEMENALMQEEAQKPITESQVKTIKAVAEKKGSMISDICEYFNVSELEEMTAQDYGICLNMLNAKR